MSILNISNIENNTELKTDFCIIGAGMSGQIIASNIVNKKIIIIVTTQKIRKQTA